MDKKDKNINNIKYMYELSKNWNNVDAIPFSEKAIEVFLEVIENINIQPDIAPTRRNSMYFEYITSENAILAYELKESSLIETYVPAENGKRIYEKAVQNIYNKDFVEYINKALVKHNIKET